MIIHVVLSKVFNNLFTFFKFFLWINVTNFFQEGLCHQFVINCRTGYVHFYKGEDLDNLWVSFNFEESLSEHQGKLSKFVIIENWVSLLETLLFLIRRDLQVSIDSFEIFEGQLINVWVKNVSNEVKLSRVIIPIEAYRVDIKRMNSDIPFLKDMYKFQFSKFLLPKHVFFLR